MSCETVLLHRPPERAASGGDTHVDTHLGELGGFLDPELKLATSLLHKETQESGALKLLALRAASCAATGLLASDAEKQTRNERSGGTLPASETRAWSLTLMLICASSPSSLGFVCHGRCEPPVDSAAFETRHGERGKELPGSLASAAGQEVALERAQMGFGMHDDRDEREYGGRGRGGGPRAASGTRLFVSNLSFRTSWQDLKDHARQVRMVCTQPRRRSAEAGPGRVKEDV